MNAPDFAFDAIIKWACAAKDNNYSFSRRIVELQKCGYFVLVHEQCRGTSSIGSPRVNASRDFLQCHCIQLCPAAA
jgi:hypothetical protein